MKCISLFETLTGAHVKDCIDTPIALIFIVEPSDIGKAIGKQGSNVRKIEDLLKQKVKVVAFDPDKAQFLKNFLYPLVNYDVLLEGDVLKIKCGDLKTRGQIIGRNATTLRLSEDILRRYFTLEKIVVV